MKIMTRSLTGALAATAFAALPALGSMEAYVDVRDGRFVVGDQTVPVGCLQRLMTELNGDDITRSVFLTRSSVRGCIDANDPGRDVDYEVVDGDGNGTYDVRVCERVDGSMGAHCETLTVRFKTYRYDVAGTVKSVLGIDKLGVR